MYTKLILAPLILNPLMAEAIPLPNVKCFQLPLTSGLKIATTSHNVSKASSSVNPNATPKTSVTLKLDSDGIWKDPLTEILTHQISDHSLEGEMIDGDIPVYTWNTWGLGSRGGFSPTNIETLSQYQNGRLREQIGILYQLFNNSPTAIVCLQEVQQAPFNARNEMLKGLKSLNVDAEYLTQTNGTSFGQVILYRKDRYKPVKTFTPSKVDNYSSGAAGRFISTADPRQNGRVLKVYFEEQTGKRRQIAVVNVHLAHQSPNLPGLIQELIDYSQGKAPKPLAVITGDFNHTISSYKGHNTNPKVTIKQVGHSVVYGSGGSETKQPNNNVDGVIIVKP